MNEVRVGQYIVHLGMYDDAEYLVKRYHYKHKMPPFIELVVTAHEPGGLAFNRGNPVAAVVYSLTLGGFKRSDIWELSRLVRRDDVKIPLSALISKSVKLIRRYYLDRVQLLISYADPEQHHHGGVYQAANWFYHDQRKSSRHGFTSKFGGYIAARNIEGGSGPFKKRVGLTPVYGPGKYLYWLPLNQRGYEIAQECKLVRNPYPKPDLTTGGYDESSKAGNAS